MGRPDGRHRPTGNNFSHIAESNRFITRPIHFGFRGKVVDDIRRIYNHIDDVDLFIGGVSERLVDGAMLGPTFLCLIGDQMARLRRGDRLFYEEVTAQFTARQFFFSSTNILFSIFPRFLGILLKYSDRTIGQFTSSHFGSNPVRQWRRHEKPPAERFSTF